jgi:cytochrome b involved in lipid metabolism
MKNISYNMKKGRKSLFIGIAVLVVVVLILIFVLGGKNKSNGDITSGASNGKINGVISDASGDSTQNAANSSDTSNTISESDLSAHNSREDCWVAYKGKVYDITSWLPKHPGTAERIMPYCGTSSEFEQAFTAKHGTTKAAMLMKVGVFMGDFEKVGNM